MKHAFVIARLLLGLVFTVFGLNAFLHFFPSPPVPGLAGLVAKKAGVKSSNRAEALGAA